jgi:hypothetical protein
MASWKSAAVPSDADFLSDDGVVLAGTIGNNSINLKSQHLSNFANTINGNKH